MKVLGIVLARGGSKGIPGKNLAMLADKSLLEWTAEAALASSLSKVVLSTDSENIEKAGKELGLVVPCRRPAELAQDDTPALPVLQHMVRVLKDQGEEFDAVFILQPTNPLRLVSDIDGAIQLLEESGADSVIGWSPVGERHPARMKFIDAEGRVTDPPFAEASEGQRRQELSQLYLRDGSVYLTRIDVLMREGSIKGADCRAWILPPERSWNIDEPMDLLICEKLMTLDRSRYPGRPGGVARKDS